MLPLGLSPLLGLPGRLLQSVLSGLPLRLPLLDRSLPPDPALLSLLPDLPGLLLQLLLSVPSDLLLRSLLLLPPGPVLPSLRPGLSDPSLPPDPALLSLPPGLPDLLLRLLRLDPALLSLQLGLPGLLLRLLRLLRLDPALLPLQLGLPGLLLRLLRLDQSLLPDLALLSLPPGPAPLSDQSAPAHRHIQEIPADRSVPVALSAPSALLVPLAPGIPADLSAPSGLCSSSFHPAVRSFRRIPRPGIHFHSDFAPLHSRHHDKDHNPYFSYLNLLLLIFHEYSVTGYPFTILYAARPYSFLLSLSLHPRP